MSGEEIFYDCIQSFKGITTHGGLKIIVIRVRPTNPLKSHDSRKLYIKYQYCDRVSATIACSLKIGTQDRDCTSIKSCIYLTPYYDSSLETVDDWSTEVGQLACWHDTH